MDKITFDDLVFVDKLWAEGKQAKHEFSNGFTVSVITDGWAYMSEGHPYELAIYKDSRICYWTDITNDVIGYLNQSEVTDLLARVAALDKNGKSPL